MAEIKMWRYLMMPHFFMGSQFDSATKAIDEYIHGRM
jgi:hypothetical protein